MKAILALLLLGVGIQELPCKEIIINNEEGLFGLYQSGISIFNGNKTKIKDNPTLVSILTGSQFYCAGTIVSPNFVLTLPDCVAYQDINDLIVVAGSENGINGKRYAVRSLTTHPSYDQSSDYKFTVIEILGKFKFGPKIQAAKLPIASPTPGKAMTVAGWGKKNEYGMHERELFDGSMTWLAKKTCIKLYKDLFTNFTDRMGCVYNKGSTTLCKDDFGDGLIADGVVYGQFCMAKSMGFCSKKAPPVVVTDVSSVADWVKNVTGANYMNE